MAPLRLAGAVAGVLAGAAIVAATEAVGAVYEALQDRRGRELRLLQQRHQIVHVHYPDGGYDHSRPS